MLSDKKPLSMRIAELLTYSSHFKQMVGQESRSIATEGRKAEAEEFATEFHGKTRKIQKQRHGRKNKQKHLPQINTELHGNNQKHSHGRKNKQKQNTEIRTSRRFDTVVEQKGSGLFFST